MWPYWDLIISQTSVLGTMYRHCQARTQQAGSGPYSLGGARFPTLDSHPSTLMCGNRFKGGEGLDMPIELAEESRDQ